MARTYRACPYHRQHPGHVCSAFFEVKYTGEPVFIAEADPRVFFSCHGSIAKDFPFASVPVALRGRGRVPMHRDMDSMHRKSKHRGIMERLAWRSTRRTNRVSLVKMGEPRVDVRRMPDIRW